MKHHQTTVGKNDEWITPKWIIDNLGIFDLDPCSPINRPFKTAMHHYTINDDGLKKDWFGRVWLNPPFNRYQKHLWMKRMCGHNNGIALIPANMETEVFKKYVYGKASGICFLDRRPHFCYVDGKEAKANSGCTIVLIAYGKCNMQKLIESNLGYCFVEYENK